MISNLTKLLGLLACLSSPSMAINFEEDLDDETSHSASYYDSPTNTVRFEGEHSYGYYYDYDYYGQTVAAIIFLDILLPIVCCVACICIIVCIVRSARRNAHHEAHHGHHHGHHHHGHDHGHGGTTVTTVYTGDPGAVQGGVPPQGYQGNPYAMAPGQVPMQ